MNPKIKGFPLLSGLGPRFPEEFQKTIEASRRKKKEKNKNFVPQRLCEIKKNTEKPRLCVLVPLRQNQVKQGKPAKIPNNCKTMKKLCVVKNA
ncbi:hypothetical protein ASD98_12035 [Flavobacterium sp. Root186]|nr:hypothetical protein ASD98_12035 [Flavobacterium sp. Root186]